MKQKRLTKGGVAIKNLMCPRSLRINAIMKTVRMYLKEMGRVPLLDREGEVRVAQKLRPTRK